MPTLECTTPALSEVPNEESQQSPVSPYIEELLNKNEREIIESLEELDSEKCKSVLKYLSKLSLDQSKRDTILAAMNSIPFGRVPRGSIWSKWFKEELESSRTTHITLLQKIERAYDTSADDVSDLSQSFLSLNWVKKDGKTQFEIKRGERRDGAT